MAFDGPGFCMAEASKRIKEMWFKVHGEKLDLRYKANWKKIADSNLTVLRIKYVAVMNPVPVRTKDEQRLIDAAAITERQLRRNETQYRQLPAVV